VEPQTISEVVASLEDIIDEARRAGSRIGYFAALYRHVALAFQDAIAARRFSDPERMERLDVVFFTRYLRALEQRRSGARPSRSWGCAFAATDDALPLVIQHLLLGMNAHINFDLGLAVADTATSSELPGLHADFERMNAILGSLLTQVETDLARIFPLLGWLHRIAGRVEDGLIDFSMREARDQAWALAQRVAALPAPSRVAVIAEHDARVARWGTDIWRPPLLLRGAFALLRAGELTHSVPRIIDILANEVGPAGAPRRRSAARRRTATPTAMRKKIAILGGGVGALATAFALTDPDNPHRAEYDITLYQMGWRLGGKGASGRNPERSYRIEEHGMHIWFGCYHNAFRLIRRCYAELGRAPDAPLAGWQDAFKPHNLVIVKEHHDGQWLNWEGFLPNNNLAPGDGNVLLPLHDYVIAAIELLLGWAKGWHLARNPSGDATIDFPHGLQRRIDALASDLDTAVWSFGVRCLHTAHLLAKLVDYEGRIIVDLLTLFMRWLWRRVAPRVATDTEVRRQWIMFNFFYGCLHGIIAEDAVTRGLESLNDTDFHEFLQRYGFDDGGLMADSAFVLGLYDGVFAYVDGDNRIPPGATFPPNAKVETGTMLRAGVRQFFGFQGASIWKMQAGMGDTIFAPLYEVLKRRGVKFEFFHRVEKLTPTADSRSIASITVARQVDITPEQQTRGGYDPLIDVDRLPCWPSTPRYEQIVQGEQLRQLGIDLESYDSRWQPVGQRVLEAGKDFDQVVLGISLGALPYICCELIRASRKWQEMVTHLKTIRTQGLQLWLSPTAFELGWTLMQEPIMTCYEVSPLDTWADMSHLIPRESWPAKMFPLNLSYFCGPMLDDAIRMTECGPKEPLDQMDQRRWNDEAKQTALQFVAGYMGAIFPQAVGADGTFRWELLIDPQGRRGPARLEAQYWRANVQPSERYVLSVPGSSKYRLPAHDRSEFTNLYLAGDWTDNGFNLGCVEAAVQSALLASNALSGYPARDDIVGLEF
jgi:uncharacterized protein with NAD-binding domain and iron-sulfur cluster